MKILFWGSIYPVSGSTEIFDWKLLDTVLPGNSLIALVRLICLFQDLELFVMTLNYD